MSPVHLGGGQATPEVDVLNTPMQAISIIKKDREFYKNLGVLVEALKGIAISQFQALEKKIVSFEEFMRILDGFFDPLDLISIQHPFVDPHDAPSGIVAVTSDAGLLGGLNHRVMTAAVGNMKDPRSKLIVIGLQGQKIAQGYKIPCKTFTGITDENRYLMAMEIRDYVVNEVLDRHIGTVKVIHPVAISLKIQQVGELNLLPFLEWKKSASSAVSKEIADQSRPAESYGSDILLETLPSDLIEYLTIVGLGQKFFDILQLSRLAELAARTIHLEESSQKVKEIDKKLQLQYFRARHEIIDQQMRELFTARSLYTS